MTDASKLLGSFVWYDQMSDDLPGSEAFYSKAVGWKLTPNTMNDQRYTIVQAGAEAVGGLMPIPDHAKGMRAMWTGYIAVDDVVAYSDKVKAAGGVIHRPATEIPNVGTFAIAGDPFGAGFLLFHPNGENGAMDVTSMTPGHVGWRELHAGDGPKAFDFYSGLFGWTRGEAVDMGAMGKYQLFKTQAGQQGGMMTKTPETPMSFWAYYFSVDSIESARQRVTGAGGKILNGPMEVPGGDWVVQCMDPQGAMFAMVGPKG